METPVLNSLLGQWVWYELMTTDAAAARDFYGQVVGWDVALGETPPLHYGMIARADGRQIGGVLPLSAEMLAQGARPAWVGYVATADLDGTLAEILARGGKQYAPRMDIAEGCFAMVGDPSGAPFYLMQPNPPAGAEPSVAFSTQDVGSVSWNELQASDFEGAKAFYSAVFGWELAGTMDMGPVGTYQFLARDGATFGAVMPKAAHVPFGGWTYYIRVADIGAAHKAIVAGGGTVLHGPQEVPGGDYIIVGIDPQGASFGLVGKKA